MDEVMKDEVLNEVTDEMIRDWKTRFGKVYKVSSDDEDVELEVYIKKPTRAAIDRFQSAVNGKKSLTGAAQQLIFDLLLYPEKDYLVKQFEDKPGLPTSITNNMTEIMGLAVNFTVTKL